VGNRLRVVESTGNRVTWTYDNTYQLKNEQRSGSNSYNITYTYDPVGNRLTEINGGVRTTSAHDAANELVKTQVAAGVTTITFDANGNLLLSRNPSNQRTSYTWDFENRLSQVALPTGVPNTFVYNGDGQRVQEQDSTGTTRHVWDGQNILLETDGSNIIQVVYTLEPMVYGDLISQRRSGTTSFYLFDGLGSTTQLVCNTGSVTDSYLYDSLGNILLANGPTTNWFRYVGRVGYYYDVDLSKYYLRARIYDATSGRFLSRDSSTIDSSHANFYRYVSNNASTLIDPSGWDGTPAQEKACKKACKDARDDPDNPNYELGPKTAGFVLCMPAGAGGSPQNIQLYCACVGTVALKLPVSVKRCILEHELAHISNGDEVCDPNCASPYRTPQHPLGYNKTTSECKAAAVAMACLVKALAAATTPDEKKAIRYRFSREAQNCTDLKGNIKDYYKGTWIDIK
jgi:RHS repeat-associated protein